MVNSCGEVFLWAVALRAVFFWMRARAQQEFLSSPVVSPQKLGAFGASILGLVSSSKQTKYKTRTGPKRKLVLEKLGAFGANNLLQKLLWPE